MISLSARLTGVATSLPGTKETFLALREWSAFDASLVFHENANKLTVY